MLIIRDPADVATVANPAIRHLLALRFQQLAPCATPDLTCDGCFVVVEAGDPVHEIEQAVGFPVLSGLFEDVKYPDPDFQPCSEILEEHNYEQHRIYEMVFVGRDDGAFACLVIPDQEGIDADLLLMLRTFATPAVSTP